MSDDGLRCGRVLVRIDGPAGGEQGMVHAGADSLTIGCGLTLLRAADERDAHRWFALLAGSPSRATRGVAVSARDVCWIPRIEVAGNSIVGRQWLSGTAECFERWDRALAADLVEAFDLTVHFDKPLYMFSKGSARKLRLVAAFASNADLTLLETPYAALDGPSSELLTELLTEAAGHRRRGWLVHDHEVPAPLADVPWGTPLAAGAA